jgi:beta-lactamase regulating signal transducer with metallopeptidase domain
MSNFTPALILCVIQVTLLALVACVIHAVLRRRSPAVRSSVALAALIVIVGVSLLSFSPWPNWTNSWWTKADQVTASTIPAIDSSAAALPAVPAVNRTRAAIETESVWSAAWQGFRTAVASPSTPVEASVEKPSLSAPAVLGILLGMGIAVGFARLIGGWLAVARMQNSSRRIPDAPLREQVDVLQAELGCASPIELRETLRLATAATVGWRKPIILLPSGWREWSPTELRAVLAHEIAHIHHRDYAAWLLAQVGVVMHFYHPLVHWLAGRLRIDQELAADAAAAPLAGGRQSYLETLASLALRHADRRLSWPVRAFLPTRQTFLRRLEMLRDPRQLSVRSPARVRWLSFGVMVVAGLAVAGLRGPGQQTFAQSPAISIVAGQNSAAGGGQLSLAYVPRDAAVVIALRPSKLLSTDALKPVLQTLTADPESVKQFGISPDQVEELSVVYLLGGDQGGNPIRAIEPGLVIRCRADGQAKQFAETLNKGATPRKFDGKEVFVGDGRGAHHLADGRTLVYAPSEPALRRLLIAGPASKGPTALQQPWTKVSGNDVAVTVNVAALNPLLQGASSQPALAPFAPLWERTESASLGLNLGADFQLHGLVLCGSEDDAKRVRDTINAAIVLARNGLSALRDSAARIPAEESAIKLRVADVADELLEKIVTEQAGDSVTLAAKGDVSQAGNLVTSLLPAVANARKAARRAQDMNNMRNITLALHNYHDVHGHFPPAVIKSKDGKPLYSWRVEILPYLSMPNQWNQLRQDEPWDSAHNKPLLEKIPSVFHSPIDPADTNNSSYFVFTGSKALFGSPEGTKMAEILDGTSNTIAIVEAKRDIHWAKPEDIPFDPEKPVPEVGGRYEEGFLAGLGDGSVRLFPRTIDPQTLKLLIMKDDGSPIDYSRFEQ